MRKTSIAMSNVTFTSGLRWLKAPSKSGKMFTRLTSTGEQSHQAPNKTKKLIHQIDVHWSAVSHKKIQETWFTMAAVKLMRASVDWVKVLQHKALLLSPFIRPRRSWAHETPPLLSLATGGGPNGRPDVLASLFTVSPLSSTVSCMSMMVIVKMTVSFWQCEIVRIVWF